ncbi:MAG: LysR family transcriptional regulator [Verrucomicrobiales bacterium]|nr:LysR family transcriptional regulator [Verrucomicrobiales bacterium]
MSKSNRSNFKLDTDLLSLRSLIAVVEEGGFSAAAKRVGRTQSAISLQVAKLEDRLGAKLLERTSRSVSVTPAGEIFLSYARRILELSDEAFLAVSAPEEKTLLRVGFAEYLAPRHLPNLLARFRRAHPNCELSLVLGMGVDLFPSMDDGKLDLVFAGPEADNGTLLWEEELAWTGPGKESAAAGFSDPAGADGNGDQPLDLVLMHPPCSYRKIAFDSLTRAGKPWKMSIEANSVQAVQSAIRAGLGISVLPRSAVAEDLAFLSGDTLPDLPNTAVMSYERPDQSHPYAQRFIDFLLASVEGG